ncbi:hypothetical protein QBC47DRAFT_396577 [Echria macrotheca]|uniref:Uncharacterized protein n=1 Tax=Echria macrotheca TaxID=438768 RepID=A0AAJ0FAY9_9PEZI|nr:hypothetical protein QBC47DRAFT_396577 [Echria macrotheca]
MSTTLNCALVGKPEFYGLGIRTAFYLLWFGLTISRWIPSPELFLLLLGMHFIFACAVFLGLVTTLAGNSAPVLLSAADIYLAMLLMSGLACYARIPYYIWRVATAFRTDMDSGFYYYHLGLRGREHGGPLAFSIFETVLMACCIAVQLWFWCAGVDSSAFYANGRGGPGGESCEQPQQQVGFVFKPADLQSPGFRALNSILLFGVAGGTVVIALAEAGWISTEGGSSRSRRRRRRLRRWQRISHARRDTLKRLQTACDLLVTPILISAIELTITWNNISNVNAATTPAQLIPLLVGASFMTLVVIQLCLCGADGGSETDDESTRRPVLITLPQPPSPPLPVPRGVYIRAYSGSEEGIANFAPHYSGASNGGSTASNGPGKSAPSSPEIQASSPRIVRVSPEPEAGS